MREKTECYVPIKMKKSELNDIDQIAQFECSNRSAVIRKAVRQLIKTYEVMVQNGIINGKVTTSPMSASPMPVGTSPAPTSPMPVGKAKKSRGEVPPEVLESKLEEWKAMGYVPPFMRRESPLPPVPVGEQ